MCPEIQVTANRDPSQDIMSEMILKLIFIQKREIKQRNVNGLCLQV